MRTECFGDWWNEMRGQWVVYPRCNPLFAEVCDKRITITLTQFNNIEVVNTIDIRISRRKTKRQIGERFIISLCNSDPHRVPFAEFLSFSSRTTACNVSRREFQPITSC